MIPQYEPLIDYVDLNKRISTYLESGTGWLTEFKQTETFENMIKHFLGVKHCFCVSNGTISLSLALLAGNIGVGDEVIIPAWSMIATANAVRLIGAKPVFVDVNPNTGLMSSYDLIKNIHSNTKAIIMVTLNGRSDLDIIDIAKSKGLFVISDDAQSFGSKYSDGTFIGNYGDISSFSFSMPKIIQTGQGGALCTNNDDLAYKIKKLKDFGRTGGGLDIHDDFGINSKITEFQAITGISQIQTIAWRVERKKQIYKLYQDNLPKEISFLETDLSVVTPWFMDIFTTRRDALAAHLKSKGIGTRLVYPPIPSQKIYSNGYHPSETGILSSMGLWLPSSLTLTDQQIIQVCDIISDFFTV